MKITKKQLLCLWVTILLSGFCMAGKEAGDSELAIREVDGTYKLASLYFDLSKGEELKIDEKLKNLVISILKNSERMLLGITDFPKEEVSPLSLSKNTKFLNAMFSPLKEYILVGEESLKCKEYIEIIPDQKTKLQKLACEEGDFVYINREIFPKLTILEAALLLIHEGIHSFDPKYNHTQISDLVKAIYLIETKLNASATDLNLSIQEQSILEKFPQRVGQLLNVDKFTNIVVGPKGVILSEGSSLSFEDDSNSAKGPSYVSPGVRLEGDFILKNTQIHHSFLKLTISRAKNKVELINSSYYNSDVFFKDKVPYYMIREDLSADFILNRPHEGNHQYNLRNISQYLKDHGQLFVKLFDSIDSGVPVFTDVVVKDSNLETSYLNQANINSCHNIVAYVFDGKCENSSLLALWLEGDSSIDAANLNWYKEHDVFLLNSSKLEQLDFSTATRSEYDLPYALIGNSLKGVGLKFGGLGILEEVTFQNSEMELTPGYFKKSYFADSKIRLKSENVTQPINYGADGSHFYTKNINWSVTESTDVNIIQYRENSGNANLNLHSVVSSEEVRLNITTDDQVVSISNFRVEAENGASYWYSINLFFEGGKTDLSNITLQGPVVDFPMLYLKGKIDGSGKSYCITKPSIFSNSRTISNSDQLARFICK